MATANVGHHGAASVGKLILKESKLPADVDELLNEHCNSSLQLYEMVRSQQQSD